MAKIISYKNNISEELEKTRNQKNKGLKKILIAMVIAVFIARPIAPLILAGGIIYLFTIGSYGKIYNILIRKEMRAEELFDGLPDSYTILCDAKIKVDGKESLLDYIIVGQNGIFVAAANNLDGAVYGNDQDDEWRQETTGRKGEQVINTFYNPIKQADYKARMLSGLLGDNEVADMIKGFVYFGSPSVELSVTTDAPVFNYSGDSKDVVNFIKRYKQEKVSAEKQEEVVNKVITESSLSDNL